MADDDYSAAGGANLSHTPGKHRGPRFSWTSQYEATFFRSLCESVRLNQREGSTFKQEAWDRAIQALANQHNAFANKGHLINKSDNARKKFRLWRGLREDPEFIYDPSTRMVTASEEAWKRHIEKEPLSRSFKGRPIEHEEYYEILFPDVVGSGGAPKRLTKNRRRDGDISGGLDGQDAPGAGMMGLMPEPPYGSAPQTQIPTPVIPPKPANIQHPPHPHARPPPTIPTRSSIGSSSALTPPEDTQHTRKRFQPAENINNNVAHPEKRRRATQASATAAAAAAAAAPPTFLDLTQTGVGATPVPAVNVASVANMGPAPAAPAALSLPSRDLVPVLIEAIQTAKMKPSWSEQAVDLFFRDFHTEDMDLQLKIAEKVLTDENKAMVFTKMPKHLRDHWVRRLREMHNQRMT
ncbi:hypothetical protein OQA88_9121 [Cercophora sp. LCS_1]